MNAAEALRVELEHCAGKAKYGQRQARQAVRWYARNEGVQVSPYRCPFCGSWHVGRAPSLETLRRVALAIRARSGCAP